MMAAVPSEVILLGESLVGIKHATSPPITFCGAVAGTVRHTHQSNIALVGVKDMGAPK